MNRFLPRWSIPSLKPRSMVLTLILTMALLGLMISPLVSCAKQQDTKSVPAAKGKSDKTDKTASKAAVAVNGWLHWRGPQQNGTSVETGLPAELSLPDFDDNPGKNHLWEYELKGQGTPVVAGDKVYGLGYRGYGPDLQEIFYCLEADTGKVIWEKAYNDFLSDIIYNRYSIGSPTIDPETGKIYVLSSPGLFMCFDSAGKLLWKHSLLEKLGRMTFPNGRTGAPVISEGMVILHGIMSNWGRQGPPRNRFYGFEKDSGKLVWASTPGLGPPYLKDSSFSTPVLADQGDQRVIYCGIGSGAVVAISARTGGLIWRDQIGVGGVNSSVVVHGDNVIATFGKQNTDSAKIGRMWAINRMAKPGPSAGAGAPPLGKDAEVWRNDISMFTSSPVLVGDRVYQVDETGNLHCVNANSGKILWTKKLGNSQIHASPAFADGKLYVPMADGKFWVLKPSDTGAEELSHVQLEGTCLGAPAIWNGKIYIHTTDRLYCFGKKGDNASAPKTILRPRPKPKGPAIKLRVVPIEVLLRPGKKESFRIVGLDSTGVEVPVEGKPSWKKYIPATAKVKARLDAEFNDAGELVANPKAVYSAGAYEVTIGDLKGYIRGRILPAIPFKEDFQGYELTVDHKADKVKFAYPPLPWFGARYKWEIREHEGSKVFVKTIDKLIFQRSVVQIGSAEMTGYTIQADVMSDGNRRLMSTVGLLCQRYLIELKGNHQQLEISSNKERIKQNVRAVWQTNTWYTLKARVDLNDDGSGVIKAKFWKRSDTEPAEWSIEVQHANAHKSGSPGLYGFAPQSKFRAYIDNISVTPNK
jgi:outer membrane protein assembly factor BamB